MCATADHIVTFELAWLLVGTIVWMLMNAAKPTPMSMGGFIAGVGTVNAWPVVVVALLIAVWKRRAGR